jgi:hypothetical protein
VPRYYFHISSYGQLFRDDQGAQLKELSDAHAYGVKLQQKLAEYCEGSHDVVRIADRGNYWRWTGNGWELDAFTSATEPCPCRFCPELCVLCFPVLSGVPSIPHAAWIFPVVFGFHGSPQGRLQDFLR